MLFINNSTPKKLFAPKPGKAVHNSIFPSENKRKFHHLSLIIEANKKPAQNTIVIHTQQGVQGVLHQ
jgi:hypothetical protein